MLLSAHEYEHRDSQRKRVNCNRHSQELERGQLSDKGRDRASQLVVGEISVDFTKHTLLSSAPNERIVIVTDKYCSAVNRPIKVGIVPLSWLSLRYLSISQSTHSCYQHTNTNKRDSANETIVIVTDKYCSEVNCPIEVGIVPYSW